jgi:hypothetical protein
MVKQYVEDRLYRDNPLLQHAMDSTEPFYFDEIGELKDLGAAPATASRRRRSSAVVAAVTVTHNRAR